MLARLSADVAARSVRPREARNRPGGSLGLSLRPVVSAPAGTLGSPDVPLILLATDADRVYEELDATVGDDSTAVHRVHSGADILPALKVEEPDLIVLDMQTGNMGAIATCHDLRLEEGAGRIGHYPVLILLDRDDDLFLARRSEADGWLIKPLDAFRVRKAVRALLAGDTWFDKRHLAV